MRSEVSLFRTDPFTSALQVMLCIENISAQYHGQNHDLFVDYFQHIIT